MEYALEADLNNYFRWMRFAEAFPDETIVATVWRQLIWSHFRELLPLKQPLQREFYAKRRRTEDWSVRTLSENIGHFTLKICTFSSTIYRTSSVAITRKTVTSSDRYQISSCLRLLSLRCDTKRHANAGRCGVGGIQVLP